MAVEPPREGSAPSWSAEDVRELLSVYGRTPKVLLIEQMDSWWFNLVLRVQADGEDLVLRRYGVTPPEEVQWELAVLEYLARNDFPTYSPLLRSDGIGSRVVVYDYKRIPYRIDRPLTGLAGPDYDATISFGLPFEPEDSQYGKSRLTPPTP